MQQAITILELEIKNTDTYVDWLNERLRTGDLQDSTIEFYDNELQVAQRNLSEYKTALAVLKRVHSSAFVGVEIINYFYRLRKRFALLMGPRLPITQEDQDVKQASNQ